MTNNEILAADLLDIVFDNRNKKYGAYALRREYNYRLLKALGLAMSIVALFVLLSLTSGKNNLHIASNTGKADSIVIKTITLPRDPIKPIEKIPEVTKPKPLQKVASVKFVSRIAIVKEVKTPTPDISTIDKNVISDNTVVGKPDDGVMLPDIHVTSNNGGGTVPVAEPIEKDFVISERQPEFPGGPEALRKFLANNLGSPGDLETGEKKMVQIRFKVDRDGSINTLEIVASGGNDYDREVIRVCKKMPRWKPAIQNGVNVPVSYILPVTFIGIEQ